MKEMGTFFIPEGATRTVTFPGLREGNDESHVLLCNDRGTLLAPAYVEEAESDGLLMLKQYNAGSLVGSLRMLWRHDLADAGQPVEIRRLEGGGYDVDAVVQDDDLDDAADAM